MSLIRGLGQWLRVVFRRSQVEQELEEELRDHAAREYDRQLREGARPEEAARLTSLRIGNLEAAKDTVRDARGGQLLADAVADMRFGLRGLRRNPGFTAAIVLSLGLGVAGTTAIASVAYAVLLRPLPYPAAGELHFVRVWWNSFSASLSPVDVDALQEEGRAVGPIAAFYFPDDGFTMTTKSGPEIVKGGFMTAGLPGVLGIRPSLGPGFSTDPNADEVLIGTDLWRSQLGGNPDAIGRTLTLDGRARTVVGVMPIGFSLPGAQGEQAWVKGGWKPPTRRGPFYLNAIVRLPPGQSADRAASQLTTLVTPILQSRTGTKPDWRYGVQSIQDAIVSDARKTLTLALGAVGLVLLVAILNVANLLLARGTARMRELAVRASLGAGRGRLARQVITESALLGLLSGGLGLAVAAAALSVFRDVAVDIVPRAHEVRLDVPTAIFALVSGIGAGVLASLAPMLRQSWIRLSESLRDGGRGVGHGRRDGLLRRTLVAFEIATALTVLMGAALLAKTLLRLEQADPGFKPDHVVSFRLALPDNAYTPERTGQFLDALEGRIQSLPPVDSVAFAGALPPNRMYYTNNYTLEGQAPNTAGASGVAVYVEASPAFFSTLGITLMRGRLFTPADGANAPPVAVVSESFSRRHFPSGDAIGKRLKGGNWSASQPWTTIVGIVPDVPYENGVWGGGGPAVYNPLAQNLWHTSPYVVVKSKGDPTLLVSELRRAVQSIDPDLPLRDVSTMHARLDASTSIPRFRTWLAVALAAIALALALTGIYGVMAYHVSQRRRETAIRRALGARGEQIVGKVVMSGLGLTVSGILVGLAGAFALTRSLRAILFQVDANDPAVFASGVAILLVAALVACLLPAIRAARLDPIAVLRDE